MSEMTTMLRRELAQLESELRLDPRYVKIERIRALLKAYDTDGELPHRVSAPPQLPTTYMKRRRIARRPLSKAARIQQEVENILAEKLTEHRSKILEHLKAKGLMGHEKNPTASLAAYLSDWKEFFVADGKGNFSLTRSAANPNPNSGREH